MGRESYCISIKLKRGERMLRIMKRPINTTTVTTTIMSVLLIAIALTMLNPSGITPRNASAGTSGIPITNITELQNMSYTGTYYLANDIDASVTSTWNSGAGFLPYPFNGILDGNGHTITDLFIYRPTTDEVGLFSRVQTSSQIIDVSLEDANITGQNYVGGLVGRRYGGTIVNSQVDGDIGGTDYVGAFIGIGGASINNCFSTGSVTGEDYVGGLVGGGGGSIINSYSSSNVTASSDSVGGILGKGSASIQNSYANGIISGAYYMGGLVGVLEPGGSISNSYYQGNIVGYYMGGLVGVSSGGSISNSYYVGNLTATGSMVGALVGWQYGGATVTNSYATCSIGGSGSYVGGLVGRDQGTTTNSSCKTTNQLKQQATFPSWDFASLWGIDEGVSYPYLQGIGEGVRFNLTTSSTMGGSVTTPGEGVFAYAPDSVVSIVASGSPGYEFTGWTGTGTPMIVNTGSPNTTITMYADYSVAANFQLAGITVDIYVGLQGAGRPEPDGWKIPVNVGFYPANSGTLVLSGSPVANYYFSGTTVMTIVESATKAYFTCPEPVAPGTYDITIDGETTLLNVNRNVGIW